MSCKVLVTCGLGDKMFLESEERESDSNNKI